MSVTLSKSICTIILGESQLNKLGNWIAHVCRRLILLRFAAPFSGHGWNKFLETSFLNELFQWSFITQNAQFNQPPSGTIPFTLSSILLVYHFCLHAQHFCSTWMTSCMQFEKIEGWSFWTGISVKGWRCIGQVRRYKKERILAFVRLLI